MHQVYIPVATTLYFLSFVISGILLSPTALQTRDLSRVRYWKIPCIESPLLLTHPSKNPITTGEPLGAFSPVSPVDQARFAQAVDLFGLGITYQFRRVDVREGSG